MSEREISSLFSRLSVKESNSNMDPEEIQRIVNTAVAAALHGQQQLFDLRINEVVSRVERAARPQVTVEEVFVEATINQEVVCNEGLDAVKSLPEFSGNKKDYLSFRRAAHVAYKMFEPYVNSSKHYAALSIIRNKIKGPACDKLTGHNTVLNFKAIISRLDREYGDKRPLHMLEQEMSTLRQGSLSVADYYDQVQLKLTALTNKALMSFEPTFSTQLNDKFRRDALRVFISGLKKSIGDTLFASRPEDLPAALALAEELEGNSQRYLFASNFIDKEPRKPHTGVPNQQINQSPQINRQTPGAQNAPSAIQMPSSSIQNANPKPQGSQMQRRFSPVEPMEVDPSLRTRRAYTDRRQNINCLEDEVEDLAYEEAVRQAFDNEVVEEDNINFLEEGPCSHL